MKTTFKLSTLALVMALTACSSSGGGSSPSALVDKAKETAKETVAKVEDGTKETTTNVEDMVKETTTKVEDTVKDAVDKTKDTTVVASKSGSYWLYDETTANNKSFSGDLKTANGNTLVIDGKTFQLANYDQKGQKELTHNYFGYGVKDFGVSGKETIVVYSFGTLTNADKIPQNGKAIYKGDAIYGSDEINGVFTTDAKSELSVDFGAKTVNGRVYSTTHNIDEKFPTANISGNAFEGNSGSNLQVVRGHFFGANAEEIGGIYSDDEKGSVVSFGATKQQ